MKQPSRRARSFRSNGWLGRLPLVSTRTIAGAGTSSPTVPPGEALCCDVTLVSALTREGHHCDRYKDGAALAVAEHRKRAAYRELLVLRQGAQRLCALERRVAPTRSSARPLAQSPRAPAPLRGAATQSSNQYRRWWGLLPVKRGCAKHACCHFAWVSTHRRPHAWCRGTACAERPA